MTKTELKDIAKELTRLEQECQNGNNVSKNMSLIEEIMSSLSMDDLIRVNAYLEKIFDK